jgi:hypothetical protein
MMKYPYRALTELLPEDRGPPAKVLWVMNKELRNDIPVHFKHAPITGVVNHPQGHRDSCRGYAADREFPAGTAERISSERKYRDRTL